MPFIIFSKIIKKRNFRVGKYYKLVNIIFQVESIFFLYISNYLTLHINIILSYNI